MLHKHFDSAFVERMINLWLMSFQKAGRMVWTYQRGVRFTLHCIFGVLYRVHNL